MTDDTTTMLPAFGPVLPHEFAAEADVIERAFAAGPYGHLPKRAERRAFERDTAGRAASGAVLVARRHGGIVGSASVLRAATPYSRVAVPGEAELRLLAVDPEAQGGRLGEALLRASLEAALEWGADALVLDTGALNVRAQALYERLGFERVPERDASCRPARSRPSSSGIRCSSATTCACGSCVPTRPTRSRRSPKRPTRSTSR